MHEFLVLAKHLNYTSAAQALYISQPTLSRHINALEEELGVSLLNRSRHDVSLTPSGEDAVIAFDFIMQHCDALASQLGKITYNGVSGLALGMVHLGPSTIYGNRIIEYFEKNIPDVSISSVRTHISRIPINLERSVIDAAVVMSSPGFESTGMSNLVVDEIPVFAIVRRNHPWAQKKSVSLKELAAEHILSPHHPFDEFPFIEMLFKEKGIEYLGVESDAPLDSLLDYRDISSAVPVRGSLSTADAKGGLSLVPVENGTITQNVSILYRKNNTNPNLQTLIQNIPHIPKPAKGTGSPKI